MLLASTLTANVCCRRCAKTSKLISTASFAVASVHCCWTLLKVESPLRTVRVVRQSISERLQNKIVHLWIGASCVLQLALDNNTELYETMLILLALKTHADMFFSAFHPVSNVCSDLKPCLCLLLVSAGLSCLRLHFSSVVWDVKNQNLLQNSKDNKPKNPQLYILIKMYM